MLGRRMTAERPSKSRAVCLTSRIARALKLAVLAACSWAAIADSVSNLGGSSHGTGSWGMDGGALGKTSD